MNYFKNVSGVKYEGPDSNNPLAFKYYNPEEMINGKKWKIFSVLQYRTGIRSLRKAQILSEMEQ